MTDLNDLAVFVKVAQLGSFSLAAKALGMPVSTVSRRITALEERLGVTLLQRTTRKLSLTPPGRSFLDHCSEPLGLLSDAERLLTETHREPEGRLRITGPVQLREAPFLELVSRFQQKYPKIGIDLVITNEFVDLVSENVDLAIRFGTLEDSTLVIKKLGTSVHYLVATPAYCRAHGTLSQPEELKKHRCVFMKARNGQSTWKLVSGRKRVSVNVAGDISCRDTYSVSFFTRRGHGIGLLPAVYCTEPLQRGELVRVLPQWTSPQFSVHAVYPTKKFPPLRLKLFLDELTRWESPFWTRE